MGFLPGIESTDGSLPAYERVFAARPEVYAAWRSLVAAIRDGLDDRTYEVATVGAARALHSTYCSLAHSVVLLGSHVDEDGLRRILAASDSLDVAETTGRDDAVASFAAQVAVDAPNLDEGDVAGLRWHGLSEEEVLDVILTAAARCFFSTVLDATGTRSDPVLRDRLPSRLVDELASGRPAG